MSKAADLAALIVDVNTTEAKTDELTGKTTAGSIAVTGEGGSTTTNLQQGLTKAWSTMDSDASTISFLDSFNSSSAVDNGTGKYGANWTNSLANVNYYSCGVTCYQSTVLDYQRYLSSEYGGGNMDRDRTTSQATVGHYNGSAYVDTFQAGLMVQGDLA